MPNTTPQASTAAATNVYSSVRCLSLRRPRFQFEWMPTDSSVSSGSIDSMKTGLKYGGPTDTVPSLSASEINGASVPANTVAAAITSSTLLKSRNDSRAPSSKPAVDFSSGARQAYRLSAPPIITMRKARMKMPRDGSAANECTDTSTPERTRKVPSMLMEKARIASSSVQLLNSPRLSVTASECTSAVPTSHGMNEAFSTGSQNQKPPQPSS